MYCCGAGTAADTEMTTQSVASQLELHRLHTGRTVPVATAATLLKRKLFRYQGYIGAALVLGGVDRTGPHIYCIYPHGSVDKLPYATMGEYINGKLYSTITKMLRLWDVHLLSVLSHALIAILISRGLYIHCWISSNVIHNVQYLPGHLMGEQNQELFACRNIICMM